MTEDQARQLAEFVKDHDKRFTAKAKPDGSVLLTQVSDGKEREPITSVDQYRADYIDQSGPGPTVRAAWESWRQRTQ